MESYPRKSVPIFYSVFVLAFLFFTVYAKASILSNSSNETSSYLDTQHLSSAKVGFSVQDPELNLKKANGDKKVNVPIIRMRRKLSGLGSFPPSCTNKCGQCSPCMPVLVRIHSGMVVPTATDYFPPVWRCKCGNKLYIP